MPNPTAEYMARELVALRRDHTRIHPLLRILSREGRLITYVENEAQRRWRSAIDDFAWVVSVKARQLGSTTGIAANLFPRALLTPGYNVLVVAHTRSAAKKIFAIYKRYYENLPGWLQACIPTVESSANSIKFDHGGGITVTTAGSKEARSSTYQAVHASEVAFWERPSEAIAAIFQTLSGVNPLVLLESTANGLNDFYKMWSSAEDRGYFPLFLPWTIEPEYARTELPDGITVPDRLTAFATEHGLTDEQLNWAAETLMVRCAGNWRTFLQEQAIDPISCFVSSGSKVYSTSYTMTAKYEEGIRIYSKPDATGAVPYVMGVDVASGAPEGDYSAWIVLDAKNNTIMASQLTRCTPLDFADEVASWAKKYRAVVVVEANSYGLPVLEYIRANHPDVLLYHRLKQAKAGDQWTEHLGFYTTAQTRPLLISEMISAVESKRFRPTDLRLQYEMDHYVYLDNGRPDHQVGYHDDMHMAACLALAGREQATIEWQSKPVQRPRTASEAIQMEIRTGRTLKQLESDGVFEHGSASPAPYTHVEVPF